MRGGRPLPALAGLIALCCLLGIVLVIVRHRARTERPWPPPGAKFCREQLPWDMKDYPPDKMLRYESWNLNEAAEKERFPIAERAMDCMELGAGMTVADVGAGGGYFSFYLAERVGAEGMVYAVDVDPGAVEVLRYRIRKRKLANVKAVLSTLSDARLPAESLDRALLCATYHLVYHQETKTGIFASLRRALRPSGRLCIVDAKSGPKAVDQDTAIADICSMGFRLRSSDVPGSDYILVFDPVK